VERLRSSGSEAHQQDRRRREYCSNLHQPEVQSAQRHTRVQFSSFRKQWATEAKDLPEDERFELSSDLHENQLRSRDEIRNAREKFLEMHGQPTVEARTHFGMGDRLFPISEKNFLNFAKTAKVHFGIAQGSRGGLRRVAAELLSDKELIVKPLAERLVIDRSQQSCMELHPGLCRTGDADIMIAYKTIYSNLKKAIPKEASGSSLWAFCGHDDEPFLVTFYMADDGAPSYPMHVECHLQPGSVYGQFPCTYEMIVCDAPSIATRHFNASRSVASLSLHTVAIKVARHAGAHVKLLRLHHRIGSSLAHCVVNSAEVLMENLKAKQARDKKDVVVEEGGALSLLRAARSRMKKDRKTSTKPPKRDEGFLDPLARLRKRKGGLGDEVPEWRMASTKGDRRKKVASGGGGDGSAESATSEVEQDDEDQDEHDSADGSSDHDPVAKRRKAQSKALLVQWQQDECIDLGPIPPESTGVIDDGGGAPGIAGSSSSSGLAGGPSSSSSSSGVTGGSSSSGLGGPPSSSSSSGVTGGASSSGDACGIVGPVGDSASPAAGAPLVSVCEPCDLVAGANFEWFVPGQLRAIGRITSWTDAKGYTSVSAMCKIPGHSRCKRVYGSIQAVRLGIDTDFELKLWLLEALRNPALTNNAKHMSDVPKPMRPP
jgi:hypothetical protein